MMKHRAITRVVAVTVLVVAAGAAVLYLDHLPPSRLAALLGISVTVTDLQGTPSPSPAASPLPLGERIPTLALSTVAIQTFSGSKLVKTAAGTVVSSDGLIVTTTAGAPFGSGLFVYQVVTAKGSLVRARRVAFDGVAGLVLLKADGVDTDAIAMNRSSLVRAGDELTVIGATVSLSRYSSVILPTTVAYVADKSGPMLSLDRSYLPVLVGARVVDMSGNIVGLLNQGGTLGIIDSATIETFVNRHLSSQ